MGVLWSGFIPNFARLGPRIIISFLVLEQLKLALKAKAKKREKLKRGNTEHWFMRYSPKHKRSYFFCKETGMKVWAVAAGEAVEVAAAEEAEVALPVATQVGDQVATEDDDSDNKFDLKIV